MSLTEATEIGQIEVVGPFRIVQVRVDNVISRDGVEISREYHRHSITPDISADDLANEDAEVQGVCNTVHTQAVKDAYAAALAAIPTEPEAD